MKKKTAKPKNDVYAYAVICRDGALCMNADKLQEAREFSQDGLCEKGLHSIWKLTPTKIVK